MQKDEKSNHTLIKCVGHLANSLSLYDIYINFIKVDLSRHLFIIVRPQKEMQNAHMQARSKNQIQHSSLKSRHCKASYFGVFFKIKTRVFHIIINKYVRRMKLKTFSISSNGEVSHEGSPQTVRQLNFPVIPSTGEFKYKNQVNFEKILNNDPDSTQIKIVNQLCTQKGSMLEKVTSIKFGDQIITIKDQYHIEALGTKIVEASTKKRVHIFKKSLAEKQEGDSGPRITNNLPKNYIKAFMNYLQDVQDSKIKQKLQSRIKLLRRKYKFNNNFIQKIVDDQELQLFFTYFLQNYAQNWIENSKIKNKKMHLQARKVFLKLKASKKNIDSKSKPQTTNSMSNQVKQSYLVGHQMSDLSLRPINCRQSEKDSILGNESQDQEGKLENSFQQGLKKYNFDL